MSAFSWLSLLITVVACQSYPRSRRRHVQQRAVMSNNIFNASDLVQKDVTIIYKNYTGFFDDDAYISKAIALPIFRLTLELANAYATSPSDMSADLNAVLYGYLSDKLSSGMYSIKSVSLKATPVSRRRIKESEISLRRRGLGSNSTASFLVSGNATFSGGNATYLTEQVNNITVAAMSDSTSVLHLIQTQSTTPGLKSSYGLSTNINGQSFSMSSSIISSPQTQSGSPMSLTLALGYGAIGLAGIGVLIAVYIISRRAWRRKGHKNEYQNQANAPFKNVYQNQVVTSPYVGINSKRIKRVQFNHEADTSVTIASPGSSFDASPFKEDDIELSPPSAVGGGGDKASWGHVHEIFEEDNKQQNTQCTFIDLDSIPSPKTLTHQGFLDFLFGRPSVTASPDIAPVRVIGDPEISTPRKREVLVFETSKWSPPPVPTPTSTKNVTPMSAIEGLTFVSSFHVDNSTNPHEGSNEHAFLLPQCVTGHVESPFRSSSVESRPEFQNKNHGDSLKEKEDLSKKRTNAPNKNHGHALKGNKDRSKTQSKAKDKNLDDFLKDSDDHSSICSSDSSSLGLDMVRFIRETMERSEPTDSQLLLENYMISDDETLHLDRRNRGDEDPSSDSVSSSPKKSKQFIDKPKVTMMNHLSKTHDHKDALQNRRKIPMTSKGRSDIQLQGLGRRQASKTDNSLLDSEEDGDVYCSDDDAGVMGYSKERQKNYQSPAVKSPRMYKDPSGARLGAEPVNSSLLAQYDEEDVGMMDSSYEGMSLKSRRKDLASNRLTRSSDFLSNEARHEREKTRYNSLLAVDNETVSDVESRADRYVEKKLVYSNNLKISPRRKKEDGSFPKL